MKNTTQEIWNLKIKFIYLSQQNYESHERSKRSR
jgi:hypothetical protein